MNLRDVKLILTDLLEYEITDSLLNVYIERDSLNTVKVVLKDRMIERLKLQNLNNDGVIKNLNDILTNKDKSITLKDDLIKTQKREIKKQKNLKRVGFISAVVLPILTLILLL
jgi:hypothetical protein